MNTNKCYSLKKKIYVTLIKIYKKNKTKLHVHVLIVVFIYIVYYVYYMTKNM